MGALPNNNRKADPNGYDLYITQDPRAVAGLLSKWQPKGRVTEICCGLGHMTEALETHGYLVDSFDKYDWGFGHCSEAYDATEYDYSDHQTIITNPPYNEATAIVKNITSKWKAGSEMALLLRLEFITGQERVAELEGTGLKYMLPFAFRIACDKGLGDPGENITFEKSPNSMNYAWFIWEHGYEGPVLTIPIQAKDVVAA